jgi:signal peptidase I
MNFNFELFLALAILISGGIYLFELLFFKKTSSSKQNFIFNQARSILPILIVVFAVRSFVFEPRYIPSGSLKPSLLIGDYILVNKFAYGLRLPITHQKIGLSSMPQRGDIVVFREPTLESLDLIKRVIGIPGDHISYINKILYINGHKVSQHFEKMSIDKELNFPPAPVIQYQENLFGKMHAMQTTNISSKDFYDIVVPPGNYFMMGDNRDFSADSREWGFLPDKNIIGKATRIILSVDWNKKDIRYDRFGKKIQ